MHPDATQKIDGDSIPPDSEPHFDAIIVGAGIAGSALATALAHQGRQVLLIERNLNPPDRIVGELLQPGGCVALQKLGLRDCLDGIEAVEVRGYEVFWGEKRVKIAYPEETPDRRMGWTDGVLWPDQKGEGPAQLQEGRSFHHGRFVQRLRWRAKRTPGVTLVEATVSELIKCETTEAVVGVKTNAKVPAEACQFFAPVTFVVDGCFSKFRRELLPDHLVPVAKSHFVGLLLDTPDPHATLPQPGHGHVILRKGNAAPSGNGVGPVLVYQIGKDDTRMLVDVPGAKHPSIGNGALKAYLEEHVSPVLPASLLPSFLASLNSTDPAKRLRAMPNSYLPAHAQGLSTDGVVMLGDALNMRHPLTGGGMTVALNDVCILSEVLKGVDFESWYSVQEGVEEWHIRRKGVATCVNTLAQALYSLFGADDENLEVLKQGCFKYFELGGACISGPVSMLSALRPSPLLLVYHFFSVAFYSLWVLFTHPRAPRAGESTPAGKTWLEGTRPSPLEWPMLAVQSVQVLATACAVILPVLWVNVR